MLLLVICGVGYLGSDLVLLRFAVAYLLVDCGLGNVDLLVWVCLLAGRVIGFLGLLAKRVCCVVSLVAMVGYLDLLCVWLGGLVWI